MNKNGTLVLNVSKDVCCIYAVIAFSAALVDHFLVLHCVRHGFPEALSTASQSIWRSVLAGEPVWRQTTPFSDCMHDCEVGCVPF